LEADNYYDEKDMDADDDAYVDSDVRISFYANNNLKILIFNDRMKSQHLNGIKKEIKAKERDPSLKNGEFLTTQFSHNFNFIIKGLLGNIYH